jgi:hypothetical protein
MDRISGSFIKATILTQEDSRNSLCERNDDKAMRGDAGDRKARLSERPLHFCEGERGPIRRVLPIPIITLPELDFLDCAWTADWVRPWSEPPDEVDLPFAIRYVLMMFNRQFLRALKCTAWVTLWSF